MGGLCVFFFPFPTKQKIMISKAKFKQSDPNASEEMLASSVSVNISYFPI